MSVYLLVLVGCGSTANIGQGTPVPANTPYVTPNYSILGTARDYTANQTVNGYYFVRIDMDSVTSNGYYIQIPLGIYKQQKSFSQTLPSGNYYIYAYKDMDSSNTFTHGDVYSTSQIVNLNSTQNVLCQMNNIY